MPSQLKCVDQQYIPIQSGQNTLLSSQDVLQYLDNQVIAAGDALKEKFLDHDEIDEDGLINFS